MQPKYGDAREIAIPDAAKGTGHGQVGWIALMDKHGAVMPATPDAIHSLFDLGPEA